MNKLAKKSSVVHSTLAKTASISSRSDRIRMRSAPKRAVHPKPNLPRQKKTEIYLCTCYIETTVIELFSLHLYLVFYHCKEIILLFPFSLNYMKCAGIELGTIKYMFNFGF